MWEGGPYEIILQSQDGCCEVDDEAEDAEDQRPLGTMSPSASVHGGAATAVSLRRRCPGGAPWMLGVSRSRSCSRAVTLSRLSLISDGLLRGHR